MKKKNLTELNIKVEGHLLCPTDPDQNFYIDDGAAQLQNNHVQKVNVSDFLCQDIEVDELELIVPKPYELMLIAPLSQIYFKQSRLATVDIKNKEGMIYMVPQEQVDDNNATYISTLPLHSEEDENGQITVKMLQKYSKGYVFDYPKETVTLIVS